jgi:phosphatidate phosphatase APP1
MSDPSPKRVPWLRYFAVALETVYDAVHRLLARITGRLGKPMTAEIYHVIEHRHGIAIRGRVLLTPQWRRPRAKDSALVNLIQMLKRWATPERPFSLVRVSAGGRAIEQRADREAYFDILLPLSEALHDEILIELPESEISEPAHHGIRRPGPGAKCLIISDVDDTVLVTHVAKVFTMLATTFFGNALTRQLFPGASHLYRAIRRGPDAEHDHKNPLVYVTSSPWNLHGLLHLIFKENGLPSGAFFMTDWGLEPDQWFRKSHREHKIESINEALTWYPELPVILLGDSSQYDTSAYIQVALAHPGRIAQILIRDVTGPGRLERFNGDIEKLKDSGTRFGFFAESDEAALLLQEAGWICQAQVDNVSEAVEFGHRSLFQILSDAHQDANG